MSVCKKDVEYAARLSRLEFSEEEKEELVEDLNTMLSFVSKLDELDTEGMEALVNPYYIENKFREDEITSSMTLEEVLINAPDKLDGYIVVPKVIG